MNVTIILPDEQSTRHKFQFAVLRYIHDVVTQEFLNIGVLMYSRESGYLRLLINQSCQRLNAAFAHGIQEQHYRTLVHTIEAVVAERATKTRDMPYSIEGLAAQIVPPDDSSLQFAAFGGGLCYDLDTELQRLYARLVTRYTPQISD